jgi:Uma2 family endonuclease
VTAPTAIGPLTNERWTWTVEAYDKAAEIGLFGPDPKVELLEGEVYTIAPMLPGHSTAIRKLDRLVGRELDPAQWAVGSQTPVLLNDRSEPEPDLWVAKGGDDTYLRRHPGPDDLVLVVEVADTSLTRDREQKIPAYAAAGIPYAWLVSLPEKTITAYSGPAPAERGYEQVSVFHPGETVTHPPTGFALDLAQLI